MIMDIGIYRMDIDIAQTKAYYAALESDVGCDCDGCKNFEKAILQLPEDVAAFFQQFGIDPRKPAEIGIPFSPSDQNVALYTGFYHLCGTILEGKNPWVKVSEKHYQLDERYAIHLSNDFSFFFTEDCCLVADGFPRPVIQMEFTGSLPYVLNKPNPFL